MVEGEKNVREVLNANWHIRRILVTEDFQVIKDIPKAELVSKKQLQSVSALVTNEQVLAVVGMPQTCALDMSEDLFILDGIRDPGNLGTILRTLDWFGFKQVACVNDTVDVYNPKVIAASMGSFTRMAVHFLPVEQFVRSLNMPVYGADLHGAELPTVMFEKPVAFVIGSESHGISEFLRNRISKYIKIPGAGGAESLNAAMATGIIAYQLSLRQV